MKFTQVTKSAALAAVLLAGATLPALAMTAAPGNLTPVTTTGTVRFTASTDIISPVDPTNPGEEVTIPGFPTPGTNGPLSIDWASSFDFGSVPITSAAIETFAAPQVVVSATGVQSEVPNFVQVSDLRGTLAGWTLSVQQSAQFATSDDDVLTGAGISLLNLQHASTSTDALTIAGNTTLVPGTSVNVMSAAAGYGAGTHVLRFGDQTTRAASVRLDIPANTPILAATYTTDLVWSLASVPGNVNTTPGYPGTISPGAPGTLQPGPTPPPGDGIIPDPQLPPESI